LPREAFLDHHINNKDSLHFTLCIIENPVCSVFLHQGQGAEIFICLGHY
jgi:hypothetical protein